jgi:hypothetical protein
MKEQRTEIPAGNRRLAKKRVKCLNEGLYFASSSVLTESSVLRNPLLRQSPKRYNQWLTWAFTILQTKTYPDEFRLLV